MSFGFSIGDFITLSQLAAKVVQGAREACGSHDELTREVTSLHIVLRRLERELTKPQSILRADSDDFDDRREELATLAEHCEKVLKVLSGILNKYNGLSQEKRRAQKLWKTIRFGNGEMKDLSKIRLELSTHTNAITMFLNLLSVGSLGKAEEHMINHGRELRAMRRSVNWITASMQANAGHGEGSILTSYADDDKAFWKEFRRELVKEGYSSSVLKKHKTLIRDYVKELGDRGALDVSPDEEETTGEAIRKNRMSVEHGTFIDDVNSTNPQETESPDLEEAPASWSSKSGLERSSYPAKAKSDPFTEETKRTLVSNQRIYVNDTSQAAWQSSASTMGSQIQPETQPDIETSSHEDISDLEEVTLPNSDRSPAKPTVPLPASYESVDEDEDSDLPVEPDIYVSNEHSDSDELKEAPESNQHHEFEAQSTPNGEVDTARTEVLSPPPIYCNQSSTKSSHPYFIGCPDGSWSRVYSPYPEGHTPQLVPTGPSEIPSDGNPTANISASMTPRIHEIKEETGSDKPDDWAEILHDSNEEDLDARQTFWYEATHLTQWDLPLQWVLHHFATASQERDRREFMRNSEIFVMPKKGEMPDYGGDIDNFAYRRDGARVDVLGIILEGRVAHPRLNPNQDLRLSQRRWPQFSKSVDVVDSHVLEYVGQAVYSYPPSPRRRPPRRMNATTKDAKECGIPTGYSLKHWDPTYEPILLLGSVFDWYSIGEWIFNWAVYRPGRGTKIADWAGELWFTLIAVTLKRSYAEHEIREGSGQEEWGELDDFIEAQDRLMDRFKTMLHVCGGPMSTRRSSRDVTELRSDAGVTFVNTLFGPDGQLNDVQKWLDSADLWSWRFNVNCEPLLTRYGGSHRRIRLWWADAIGYFPGER